MVAEKRAAPFNPAQHSHVRPWGYWVFWSIGRFIWLFTIRARVIRPHIVRRDGPFILACTHLSHLEPFVLSVAVNRRIDWVTRIEFFRRRWSSYLLRLAAGFPVNRQGVPVSTIRTAIARLREGRIVGICPEGGVVNGRASACRGGPLKHGAFLIAQRTGLPIVPCVMVGTDKFNTVWPWLPVYNAKLWLAYGDPVYPPDDVRDRRAARARMSEELEKRFQSLYRELCDQHGVCDRDVP